jgi:peptide/nickel transport system substrate-binding protein
VGVPIVTVIVAAAAGCRGHAPAQSTATPAAVSAMPRGGELRVSNRSEPPTFNTLLRRDSTTELVSMLTQARLVRVNRVTQALEPSLAESWTASADGLTYTLKLRRDVRFSDGEPFTSADVVFTFDALYDRTADCQRADTVRLDNKELHVSAPDAYTVVVTFPVRYAPGVRILDNVPIVPKHKLAAALAAGAFGDAWNLRTPPSDMAGLGPFVLAEYVSGQRMVFTRNPHYFRTDASGAPLPYLDRVIVNVVPEQDAQLLGLDAGEVDVIESNIRPEDYAPLKRAADAGRVKLLDLGVAYDADSFWFNLKAGAFAGDPRAAWIQRDELREAISYAVDRKAFADTVFLGAGLPVYGPETPSNAKWFDAALPATPYDPARAVQLLSSIGLTPGADGMLHDAQHQPVRFTLMTQKGKTQLERGAALVRDDLKAIGIGVDVVLTDFNSLVSRFTGGTGYDAIYFGVTRTDPDPATNPDFWFSSGSAHFFDLGSPAPAPWERDLDHLMARQMASGDDADRKRLYDQMQTIFARHQPVVYFAAPKVFVAYSSRVLGATPSILRPQVLWAADTLAVAPRP